MRVPAIFAMPESSTMKDFFSRTWLIAGVLLAAILPDLAQVQVATGLGGWRGAGA